MNSCESCLKREYCFRDTGVIFGGCNVDYIANPDYTDGGEVSNGV